LFQPYDLTGSFKGYLFVKIIIPHKYDYFNSFRHLLVIFKGNMEEENEDYILFLEAENSTVFLSNSAY
jgi:hypothetical protein